MRKTAVKHESFVASILIGWKNYSFMDLWLSYLLSGISCRQVASWLNHVDWWLDLCLTYTPSHMWIQAGQLHLWLKIERSHQLIMDWRLMLGEVVCNSAYHMHRKGWIALWQFYPVVPHVKRLGAVCAYLGFGRMPWAVEWSVSMGVRIVFLHVLDGVLVYGQTWLVL